MRRPPYLSFPLLALVFAGAGCQGADPHSGVTSYLRASNGQFQAGPLLPALAGDELLRVANVRSGNTGIFPGAQGRVVSGSLSSAATAVRIGLDGDTGHWLVPAGVQDLEEPGNFTFSTTLSFSPELPAGKRDLLFRAADARGNLGPSQALTLDVESPTPAGALVIGLEWDTQADLDLHVRIYPTTVTNPARPFFDVWAKAPLGRQTPSSSEPTLTPEELAAAGSLAFDSNAQCVIDGGRRELLVFPTAAVPGNYEIRVDTFSLCGEATARWKAFAYASAGPTEPILDVFGQSLDRDAAGPHTGGSGLLAFTVAIP